MGILVTTIILLALYIGYKIDLKIAVNSLNREFNKEAKRINELEKRILRK